MLLSSSSLPASQTCQVSGCIFHSACTDSRPLLTTACSTTWVAFCECFREPSTLWYIRGGGKSLTQIPLNTQSSLRSSIIAIYHIADTWMEEFFPFMLSLGYAKTLEGNIDTAAVSDNSKLFLHVWGISTVK